MSSSEDNILSFRLAKVILIPCEHCHVPYAAIEGTSPSVPVPCIQFPCKSYVLSRTSLRLIRISLTRARPIPLKPRPTTLRLARQKQTLNNHVIIPISRNLSRANIPPHGHIQQNRHLPQRPCPLGNTPLHDRPPINIPHHPPLPRFPPGLIPHEIVPHGTRVHVRDLGPQHAVLPRLVVLAPVQARAVFAVAVPCLGNVDLAVGRPREGFAREEPKGRPDAVGAGGDDGGGQDAPVSGQGLAADEAGRGVPPGRVWRGVVGDGSEDESAVWGANGCQPSLRSGEMSLLTGTRWPDRPCSAPAPGCPSRRRCPASRPIRP